MDYKELITMFEAALSCNKKTIQVLETTVSNNIATPPYKLHARFGDRIGV